MRHSAVDAGWVGPLGARRTLRVVSEVAEHNPARARDHDQMATGSEDADVVTIRDHVDRARVALVRAGRTADAQIRLQYEEVAWLAVQAARLTAEEVASDLDVSDEFAGALAAPTHSEFLARRR